MNQSNRLFELLSEQELERIESGHNGYTFHMAMANRSLNRYSDISPYDCNCVQLKHSLHKYINASIISEDFVFFNSQNPQVPLNRIPPGCVDSQKSLYICTQAPMENTIVDFWNMVYESGSEVIVMLTDLIEGNRVKCDKYWPGNDSALEATKYGQISVQVKQTENIALNVQVRTINLLHKSSMESRSIKHIHYHGWPDHGVPQDPNEIIRLVGIVHRINSNNKPIVVHCSAGCGRTGTFISVDMCTKWIRSKNCENFMEKLSHVLPNEQRLPEHLKVLYLIVHRLRLQRMLLVQTQKQFDLCANALYKLHLKQITP